MRVSNLAGCGHALENGLAVVPAVRRGDGYARRDVGEDLRHVRRVGVVFKESLEGGTCGGEGGSLDGWPEGSP